MAQGVVFKTAIYTIANALPALAGFLLLLPLTSYLSAEQYGIQALYLSLSLLLQIIISFGFELYLARNYVTEPTEEGRAQLVSQVYSSVIAIGAVVVLFFALTSSFSFSLIFQSELISFYPYGLMSIGVALFNAMLKLYTNLLIYKEKPIPFLAIQLSQTILYIAAVFAGLSLFPNTMVGPVGGRFFSSAVLFLFVLYVLFRREGFRFQFQLPPKSLSYCIPVLLFSLVMWGSSYGNSYVIQYTLRDFSLIGAFDLVLKFAFIIELFHNGFSAALAPRLLQLWNKNDRGENELRLHNLFNAFSLLVISLAILLLPLFWPLVVRNSAFDYAVWLFPIMAIGFAFRGIYNYYVNPIYFSDKTRRLPLIFSLSYLVQVLLSVPLILLYQLEGALLSYALSRVVQSVLLFVFNRDIGPLAAHTSSVFLAPTLYAVVSGVLYILLGGGWIFSTAQFAVAFLLVLYFYGPSLWHTWKKNQHA
jgi:O-antigen/teichoic acid export membrane protein